MRVHLRSRKSCVAQEEALVDISDTLGRLHEIGTTIGQEVDLQVVGVVSVLCWSRSSWTRLIRT